MTLLVVLPTENLNVCLRNLLWKSAKGQHSPGVDGEGETRAASHRRTISCHLGLGVAFLKAFTFFSLSGSNSVREAGLRLVPTSSP